MKVKVDQNSVIEVSDDEFTAAAANQNITAAAGTPERWVVNQDDFFEESYQLGIGEKVYCELSGEIEREVDQAHKIKRIDKSKNEKFYMDKETGVIDTADGWLYAGNPVTNGGKSEVRRSESGAWMLVEV